MNDKKIITGVVVISVFLVVIGVYASTKISTPAAVDAKKEGVIVKTETKQFDFGTVKIDSGEIVATYQIKNEGSDTLKLFNISTSCMCTYAQLFNGTETSPRFGMGKPSSYVMDVAPGQTAELKAVFDPAFHGPNGVGDISRKIIVSTNDAKNGRLEFGLTGKVIR